MENYVDKSNMLGGGKPINNFSHRSLHHAFLSSYDPKTVPTIRHRKVLEYSLII
jgi:hypothetical protein